MDLTKLTSEQFERIVALLKEKEQLTARLAEIHAELSGLQGGPSATAPGRPRGRLVEGIVAALQAAGPAGVTVPELARQMSRPNAAIHAWFQTTGKSRPEIEKIGPGRYRWKAA